jgi:hypothetical protein
MRKPLFYPLMPNKSSAAQRDSVLPRRTLLKRVGAAGAALSVGALTPAESKAEDDRITEGDVAILRFLAAVEIIESDLWQQYNELGGVNGGNAAYQAALENLDEDMPQYITDNTDDEISHVAFLNAYLASKGAASVNFNRFRTLSGSQATGADKTAGRLTNLLHLSVDTSWYTRYRRKDNPDFGAQFPQAVHIHKEPAIPLNDEETPPDMTQPVPPATSEQRRMQAIANTAAFHFAYVEQGGASLYTAMLQKVTNLEVLRIVASIGGAEVNHFAVWHDKAGNAVSEPLAGVTDPKTGVSFPDLNARRSPRFQTNRIFPEPCDFISPKGLPLCSVIRPSSPLFAGAVATIQSFTADGLFAGQSPEFFQVVTDLAQAADAAERQL